jgi:hypothetical protein
MMEKVHAQPPMRRDAPTSMARTHARVIHAVATMVISATTSIDDIRDRVVVVVVDARACIGWH